MGAFLGTTVAMEAWVEEYFWMMLVTAAIILILAILRYWFSLIILQLIDC